MGKAKSDRSDDDDRQPQSPQQQQQRLPSDPRNPARIKTYNVATNSEAETSDFASLLGLICCICGMTMRIKLMAWMGLLCSLVSFANMKQVNVDLKQVFSTLAFSLLTIVMNYLVPMPVPIAPST